MDPFAQNGKERSWDFQELIMKMKWIIYTFYYVFWNTCKYVHLRTTQVIQ